jgi:hypothetical protein
MDIQVLETHGMNNRYAAIGLHIYANVIGEHNCQVLSLCSRYMEIYLRFFFLSRISMIYKHIGIVKGISRVVSTGFLSEDRAEPPV